MRGGGAREKTRHNPRPASRRSWTGPYFLINELRDTTEPQPGACAYIPTPPGTSYHDPGSGWGAPRYHFCRATCDGVGVTGCLSLSLSLSNSSMTGMGLVYMTDTILPPRNSKSSARRIRDKPASTWSLEAWRIHAHFVCLSKASSNWASILTGSYHDCPLLCSKFSFIWVA